MILFFKIVSYLHNEFFSYRDSVRVCQDHYCIFHSNQNILIGINKGSRTLLR